MKILGIHFSYDEKRSNELNFIQKTKRYKLSSTCGVQETWQHSEELWYLKLWDYHNWSILLQILWFLIELQTQWKLNLWNFSGETKKYVIKRSGLYQEPDRGGIRMTDLNIMFKALKLPWIPRLLASDKRNWCTIPNHFTKKMGGLNFLLRCNYDAMFFSGLPTFYKRILHNLIN